MRRTLFPFLIALLVVSSARAGELKPTKDKARLTLLVENSGGKPVKNTVVSVRNEKGKRLFSEITDENGKLALLVPKGKTYYVKFVSLSDPEKETKKKIQVPDQPNFKFTLKLIYNPVFLTTFALRGVHFDTAKATLKKSSYPNLEDLVEFMVTKKTTEIELSGHTDSDGDPAANLKLSQARAEAVKKHLVKKGVEAERIVAKGYGDTKPVATNKSPEGRKRNRRTEVKILKN